MRPLLTNKQVREILDETFPALPEIKSLPVLSPTQFEFHLQDHPEMATVPTRRPSLLVNGLPSVDEDHVPMNAPQTVGGMRPSPSAFPGPLTSSSASSTSSISPQRDAAKMNMLRRMRPYPFQYAWTFYHDKHSDNAAYENRQTVLLENIITLKSFWEAYNGFPLDALKMKDSVHFFKRGVKPIWEDPRNVRGGAWTFRVPKSQSEQTWKELLLLAVGEQFADVIQPKDDLCGLSLSMRFNSNLLTIWNRDGNATDTIKGILSVILSKISPELTPKEGSYYYKKHSEHASFNDAVAKANERALISGKIEEAKVQEEEVKMVEEEERKREEEEDRRRARSQTVG